MGELTPGSGVLPHHRPLQGPAGWTYAHQAAGGAIWRDAGKAFICAVVPFPVPGPSYLFRKDGLQVSPVRMAFRGLSLFF